ncbi:MAG: hypothetical protein NZM31_03105 [Gemmatales bacterium]|nr:hypothetical protein [Gemmatales bacterium]MDW8385989.1 hypothetical protein [Gemmatales bacterium]
MTASLLVWVAAATVLQSDRLAVVNLRATFGELGPARPDWKIPLGDALHIAFDVTGLTTDLAGRIRYRVRLEVENSRGERVFAPEPGEVELLAVLGGNRARENLVMLTGLEQSPGNYRLKLTVTDLQARDSGRREVVAMQDFTLVPPDFNILRVQVTSDQAGQKPVPPLGGAGQTLFVQGVVVGFQRDTQKRHGSVLVELFIQDETGKTVSARPVPLQFPAIPPGLDYVPIRFDLPLTRPGSFRLVLKATDLLGKKTATVTLPLLVHDPLERRP